MFLFLSVSGRERVPPIKNNSSSSLAKIFGHYIHSNYVKELLLETFLNIGVGFIQIKGNSNRKCF
jgi:hypothetical protein